MLAMNSKNCARYGAKLRPLEHDANNKLETEMRTNPDYRAVWNEMLKQQVSGSEMCDYINWAYYARVELKGNMDTYQQIHNTVCKDYFNDITQANITIEWSDDGY